MHHTYPRPFLARELYHRGDVCVLAIGTLGANVRECHDPVVTRHGMHGLVTQRDALPVRTNGTDRRLLVRPHSDRISIRPHYGKTHISYCGHTTHCERMRSLDCAPTGCLMYVIRLWQYGRG
jgi:hypothetical protein